MSKRKAQQEVIRPAGQVAAGVYTTVADSALGGLTENARASLQSVASSLAGKYPKNQLLSLWAGGSFQRKDTAATQASNAEARKERLTLATELKPAKFQENLNVVMTDFASNFANQKNFVNGRFIDPNGKYVSRKYVKIYGEQFRKQKTIDNWRSYRGLQVLQAWNSFVNKLNTFISGNTAKGQARFAKRVKASIVNQDSGLTAFKGLVNAIRKKPELFQGLNSVEDMQAKRLEAAKAGMLKGSKNQIDRIAGSMEFARAKLAGLLGGGQIQQQQIPQIQAMAEEGIEAEQVQQQQQIQFQVQPSQSTVSTVILGENKRVAKLAAQVQKIANQGNLNQTLTNIIEAEATNQISTEDADKLKFQIKQRVIAFGKDRSGEYKLKFKM